MTWDGDRTGGDGTGGTGAGGTGTGGAVALAGGEDAAWFGAAARSARGLTGAELMDWAVGGLRAQARLAAGVDAARLRLVAELDRRVSAEARLTIASLPRVPGAPHDYEVIDSAVTGEVEAVLGIGDGPAARMVWLARRLTWVLPQLLDALAQGRVDLARATVLAEDTEVLADGLAREVADRLLDTAGRARGPGCRRGRGSRGSPGR